MSQLGSYLVTMNTVKTLIMEGGKISLLWEPLYYKILGTRCYQIYYINKLLHKCL